MNIKEDTAKCGCILLSRFVD